MSRPAKPREHPILFQGEMVRAILDGSKTQTRRIANPQPRSVGDGFSTRQHGTLMIRRHGEDSWSPVRCPYGKPGDLLYVRETWRVGEGYRTQPSVIRYKADGRALGYGHLRSAGDAVFFAAQRIKKKPKGGWHPSIHMPRIFARTWLEVTEVRVERVQEITEEDAVAEGMTRRGVWWDAGPNWEGDGAGETATEAFAALWDSINATPKPKKTDGAVSHYVAFPWDVSHPTCKRTEWRGLPLIVTPNPWVWVVTFPQVNAQETG